MIEHESAVMKAVHQAIADYGVNLEVLRVVGVFLAKRDIAIAHNGHEYIVSVDDETKHRAATKTAAYWIALTEYDKRG